MVKSIWQEWLDRQKVKENEQTAERVELEGRVQTDKPALEMSGKIIADYRAMLDGFAGVTFRPASYEKRFVGSMRGAGDDTPLTVKQARLIEQLYHRYRRQIPNHARLCVVCGKG
jgi:hypothetical protein